MKKSVRRLSRRLLSSQRQMEWLYASLLKHAGCFLETAVSKQLFHMIDGSKKESVTVWLQAFHSKPRFILCLLTEGKKNYFNKGFIYLPVNCTEPEK